MPIESYFWNEPKFISFVNQEIYPEGLFADAFMYYLEPGLSANVTFVTFTANDSETLGWTPGTDPEVDGNFSRDAWIGEEEYNLLGSYTVPGGFITNAPMAFPRVQIPYVNTAARNQSTHINGTWSFKAVKHNNPNGRNSVGWYSDIFAFDYDTLSMIQQVFLTTGSTRLPGDQEVFNDIQGTGIIQTQLPILSARLSITTSDLSSYGRVPFEDPMYYKLGRYTFGHF